VQGREHCRLEDSNRLTQKRRLTAILTAGFDHSLCSSSGRSFTLVHSVAVRVAVFSCIDGQLRVNQSHPGSQAATTSESTGSTFSTDFLPGIMSALEERKEEFRQNVIIEIEEDNDGEEKGQEGQYDITRMCGPLKRLLNDCSVAGITLNPKRGRPKSDRVCVLSRFSDETLKGLWEIIYPNHDKLETEEHKTKGVSACWIWKLRPGFASLENGYPVLSYRKSLSKGTKLPYLKVHQLAAFIGHGKRCGLGQGSATIRTPPGARKRVWLLVASHLCHNKRCINPDHIWPEANGWNADRGKCRSGPCICKGFIHGGRACLLSYKE
jgi:hypothetical protein